MPVSLHKAVKVFHLSICALLLFLKKLNTKLSPFTIFE